MPGSPASQAIGAVGIDEDCVADGARAGRELVAEVGVEVDVTGCQHDGCGCGVVARGAGGTGLVGIAGLGVTTRRRYLHDVSTGGQAVEDVVAGGIGGGGDRGDDVIGGAEDDHRHRR